MESISRTLISVALVGVFAGAAAQASAPSVLGATSAEASGVVSGPALAAIVPVCQDRTFRLTGGHWNQAVHWTFMSDSTPAGLSVASAETVLTRSFNNITGADNDCGRADNVNAQNIYDGRSNRAPGVTGAGQMLAR